MVVTGPYGVVLEVPDVAPGVDFYAKAGLDVVIDGKRAEFRCKGYAHPSITLIGGAERKRLHHLALRADPGSLDQARAGVAQHGGRLVAAPDGESSFGVWLEDPFGTLVHLVPAEPEAELAPAPAFEINAPGRLVRVDRSGIPPKADIPAVRPRRLGHVLVYTPDVMGSIEFFTNALGMGLADHSGDAVAFMCTRKDSDHHVVAFARSQGIGFHHASFQVDTPDDVGRGGRALADFGGRGDWGFGRHTVGANFFHYIQDPWGSWFEYFSDIDHISDYADWQPTDYASEDSLYNWGPAVPSDFVHNYETDDFERVKEMGFG